MVSLSKHLKGDVFGGITAGIVALPLALAFGETTDLGAQAGLYGAIFISFFAALFGGTNTQISGPTAPMTAISMIVVASIVAINDGDVSKALPAILLVFFLAGLIQIGLGLLKVGAYIRYIPYPVVSGFMTAIGLIIIITQLLPAIGYYPKQDTEYVKLFEDQAQEHILKSILEEETNEAYLEIDHLKATIYRANNITSHAIEKESKTLASKEASGALGALKILPRAVRQVNGLEMALALGTIFIIYGFKKITTKIPSALVALVVMTIVAVSFNFNYIPITPIPSELPKPNLELFNNFQFSTVSLYFLTAFTLALLGAIDSLLTSVVADNMTKTKHQPNKELVGQGIGNSIAAIFGGLPGAGATIRTVVNINAGGKTRLSGMISSIVLLVIMLLLAPLASQIPKAVLAGILITVGINVMDYKGLKAIPYLPRDMTINLRIFKIKLSSEVLIMLVVLGLSTFWDLIYAVGIGLVIASLMFMKRMGRITASRSEVKSLKSSIWADELKLSDTLKEKVFVKHLRGPLFFGSINDFQELRSQIPKTVSVVIIRLGRMAYMDQSGLYAMEDMLMDLKVKKVRVLFIKVLPQPRYMMERVNIIPNLINEDQIFEQLSDSIEWIENNSKSIST